MSKLRDEILNSLNSSDTTAYLTNCSELKYGQNLKSVSVRGGI